MEIKNGKVKCYGCGESVVPRLWNQNMDSWIKKPSAKHICPLCGNHMYSTGGGLTIGGYFILGFFILILIGQFLSAIFLH